MPIFFTHIVPNLLLQYKIVYVNFHSMRMFPVFLLPVSVYAATDCTIINNATTCGATAGCYWNGTCGPCPPNHYCPGGGIAYCCPEPFNHSGSQSMSISQCEAHIQCGSNPNDTAVVTCYNWQGNKCTPTNETPYYTVQWAYAGAEGINGDTTNSPWMRKQNHDWFSPNGGPLAEWNTPNNYHLEIKPIYADSGITTEWWETSFEIACVPNTKTCKSFNEPSNFPPIDCTAYNSTNCPDTQGCGLVYAGQGSGTTPVYQCTYLNNIGASIEQTNCAHENISGNAHWIAPDGGNNTLGFSYWDVSECKCDYSAIQYNSNANCYGTGTYPSIFNNTSTPNINTVHSIGEHIIFNNDDPETFICRKCAAGPYYANYLSGLHTVNKCIKIPDNLYHGYGYWRKPSAPGYCDGGDNGILWPATLTTNPCDIKPCPAGKTTTEYGPIGSDSCHYTDQTKFCDANGCFNITDAADGGWNWGL